MPRLLLEAIVIFLIGIAVVVIAPVEYKNVGITMMAIGFLELGFRLPGGPPVP
jgi:hypothetical protein